MGMKWRPETEEHEAGYVLTDFIKRGDLCGAYTEDRKSIFINYGGPEAYPIGSTVASIPVHHIDNVIAILKAVRSHK